MQRWARCNMLVTSALGRVAAFEVGGGTKPVWKRMLDSRWFYIGAAVAMVGAFLSLQLELRGDPRPQGEPSQISTLHERDDVNLLRQTFRKGTVSP